MNREQDVAAEIRQLDAEIREAFDAGAYLELYDLETRKRRLVELERFWARAQTLRERIAQHSGIREKALSEIPELNERLTATKAELFAKKDELNEVQIRFTEIEFELARRELAVGDSTREMNALKAELSREIEARIGDGKSTKPEEPGGLDLGFGNPCEG